MRASNEIYSPSLVLSVSLAPLLQQPLTLPWSDTMCTSIPVYTASSSPVSSTTLNTSRKAAPPQTFTGPACFFLQTQLAVFINHRRESHSVCFSL